MEEIRVFGNLSQEGLEVIEREGRYFVRYDAGAHQIAWREDEITAKEFTQLKSGRSGEHEAIIDLQRRLQLQGVDPYKQNWKPSDIQPFGQEGLRNSVAGFLSRLRAAAP